MISPKKKKPMLLQLKIYFLPQILSPYCHDIKLVMIFFTYNTYEIDRKSDYSTISAPMLQSRDEQKQLYSKVPVSWNL